MEDAPEQQQQQPSSLKTHFLSLAPPPLTAHITDSTGHPILTTAEASHQSHALQSLSHAYLSAHDTASRMGLGVPLRVTVGTRAGAVVMQTGTEVEGGVTGDMVVGTVVAPEERMAEARVASWGVEEVAGRVGRVIGKGRSTRA